MAQRRKPLDGLAVWVWNADARDPEQFCRELRGHRPHGRLIVIVKAHDGLGLYNRFSDIARWGGACAKHGILFGLWGYVTANDPAGQARLAAALVLAHHHAQCYVADAEIEVEQGPSGVSRTFASTFQAHHPHLPRALSTFGRLDLHPGIDYRAWSAHHFEVWPQAYECETSALRPSRCVASCRAHGFPYRAIRPSVGAYRGAAGRPSAVRLAESVRGLGTSGVGVWEAQTVTDNDLAALSRV